MLDGHLLGGLVQDLLDEHAGVLLLALRIRSELVLETGQQVREAVLWYRVLLGQGGGCGQRRRASTLSQEV